MKHLLLSFLIILGCTSELSAQFNIGLKAGLSVSNVNFSGIELPSNLRKGIIIGIPLSYKVFDNVIIGLNNEFIQKGYNLEFNGQTDYTQNKYNYLQFTPNVNFQIVHNLHVGIGLYYAIKLGEFNKVGNDVWIDTGKFEIIKNNDFGISPTMGYSHNRFLFKLSYQYGMQNIVNINFVDSDGEIIPNVKSYNRVVEIGLVYSFKINRKTDDNK